MPLPQFKNEKEFREKFIAPFLAKRGLIQVNHKHGAREQGKDFYFADYDRFENIRFCAVQAKVGNIGGSDRTVAALLDQVQRCFTVKIRFHKDAHERRCSAVYVLTTGTISENARERITDWCHTEKFGDNVYFLDGEMLSRLHDVQEQREDDELLTRLTGLLLELRFNLATSGVPDTLKLIGASDCILRTHAMQSFLAHPPNMLSLVSEVYSVLHVTQLTNILFRDPLKGSAALKAAERQTVVAHLNECKSLSEKLIESVKGICNEIHEKRSVSVEVIG